MEEEWKCHCSDRTFPKPLKIILMQALLIRWADARPAVTSCSCCIISLCLFLGILSPWLHFCKMDERQSRELKCEWILWESHSVNVLMFCSGLVVVAELLHLPQAHPGVQRSIGFHTEKQSPVRSQWESQKPAQGPWAALQGQRCFAPVDINVFLYFTKKIHSSCLEKQRIHLFFRQTSLESPSKSSWALFVYKMKKLLI